MRYQLLDWLFWNFDTDYTHARAIEENAGEDFIPLAPDFTMATGLHVIHPSGLYGGLNLRHINDRPANEDNSIIAKGYTVVDFNIGYPLQNLDFGIQILNLLNTEWNETQFATESKLKNEPAAVEEINFIPGVPFFVKIIIAFKF
jgi:outer membrane receptor protein involved in Fe transport